MALSATTKAKLADAIDAVEAWRGAKEAKIRDDAAFLSDLDIGARSTTKDVVDVAVDEATEFVRQVLEES